MSPEQVRASGDIDMRTDIWSLGCVLFELLTGRPPFDARSITMLTAAILEERAPRLSSRRPDAPPELEKVLVRCLEKDPNRRFQDVGELATALYPFAPRRARLSAERCRHVLRAAGLSQATPEIASEPPPGFGRTKDAQKKTTSSRKASIRSYLLARLAFVSQHRAKAAIVLGASMLVCAAAFWLLASRAPAPPSVDPSAATNSLPPAPPDPSPGSALGTSESLPSPTFLAVEPAATIAPPNGTPTPARSKSPASPSASASSKSSPTSAPRPATSSAQELDVGF
jgi:serine/threonine-protein kinase